MNNNADKFAAIRAAHNAKRGDDVAEVADLFKKKTTKKTIKEKILGIRWAALSMAEKTAAQLRGLKNQKSGKTGELQTRIALVKTGHLQVLSIPTIKRFKPVDPSQPRGYWTFMGSEKAAGDITSIAPSHGTPYGIPCLTEVKFHPFDRLQWSKLSRPKDKHGNPQPGQHESLIEYESDRGLALLSWVRKKSNGRFELCIMRWRDVVAAGFEPGNSIEWETAVEIRIN